MQKINVGRYKRFCLFVLCLFIITPTVFSKDAIYMVTYPDQLQQQFDDALKSKGSDYKPRSKHIKHGKPIYTNRLILEDSPYLLQHAHNPVNWYPWGEEAFATAKRENKPIFLSIGYATCHWCHVMEEESFESIAVAKLINQHFISIKVDREQYPDIDATYMEAVQLLTGRGGWPMSSFITAEGKPFFGGTYYPQPTFIDLLTKVSHAWDKQHETLLKQANQLAQAVQQRTSKQGTVTALQQSAVNLAVQQIMGIYDAQNGGFSGAPKFPQEPLLLLLLQVAEKHNNPQLLKAINHTLSVMAQGGIYDQVGGGFHRYATDKNWLVPHFEKMLYNQAYLVRIYTQAYRITQNPYYARIVRQTLDYVLREMRNQQGEFYSATDADSEGEEGTYFIWTIAEINKLLGANDATFIIDLYGVTLQGNFESKNIFYLKQSLAETAKQKKLSLDQLLARLNPLLETLRTYRQKRIPPLTDDKIIVAWNGMLITALAEAGDILGETRYIDAAKTAVNSLWKSQRTIEKELWRINLNGKSSITAKQDDYVHFSEALISLYDITGDQNYLHRAQELADEMVGKFLNTSTGTLVMGKNQLLFTQPTDGYDSTLPSGNSVAVRVFYKLFNRTGMGKYQDYATNILQAFSSNIMQQPALYPYMLAQLDEMKNGEVSAHQYAARSAIKVDAEIKQTDEQQYKLNIHLKIKPDWHINSHSPIQEQLIATTLSLVDEDDWQLNSIQYPADELVKTNIKTERLALYQGDFKISANLLVKKEGINPPLKLNLILQACDQNVCLAPETLTLYLNPKK